MYIQPGIPNFVSYGAPVYMAPSLPIVETYESYPCGQMNVEKHEAMEDTGDCFALFDMDEGVDATDKVVNDISDKTLDELFEDDTAETNCSFDSTITASFQDTQSQCACHKSQDFEVRGVIKQGDNCVPFGHGPQFEATKHVSSMQSRFGHQWSSDSAVFSIKQPFELLGYVRVGNDFINIKTGSENAAHLQWPRDRLQLEQIFSTCSVSS
jgi:hypothetical protein